MHRVILELVYYPDYIIIPEFSSLEIVPSQLLERGLGNKYTFVYITFLTVSALQQLYLKRVDEVGIHPHGVDIDLFTFFVFRTAT